jgi:hypothetical protein
MGAPTIRTPAAMAIDFRANGGKRKSWLANSVRESLSGKIHDDFSA